MVAIGKEQYNTLVEERFEKRLKALTAVMKKNKLLLFSSPLEQRPDKKQAQVAALKDDCALFLRLYIACQRREGNLQEFFKHRNHPCMAPISRSKQLQLVKRVDVIWDVYRQDSLKAATREKRGLGTRRRVTSSSQIQKNWKGFLRVNENKTELFHFLARQVESHHVQGK